MLVSLHIENIAVIKTLSLELKNSFTVLTGETGAGKSILIDSIALLCGARSDRELIRTGEDYALVEGCFAPDSAVSDALTELDAAPDEDGFVFISRRVSADGRSVAKLNGRQIPTQRLRDIASLLVNIHGQQDTQSFRDRSVMLEFLDRYCGDAEVKDAYSQAFHARTLAASALEKRKVNEDEKKYRVDYLKYRINEIELADPKQGEEEKLVAKRDILRNAELIDRMRSEAYALLYDNGDKDSVTDLLDSAARKLENAGRFSPALDEAAQKLKSLRFDAEETALTLRDGASDNEIGDAVLDRIEDRLIKLGALRHKYGSVEASLEALGQMKAELDAIENNDETVKKLTETLASCEIALGEASQKLTAARKEGALRLSEAVHGELAALDMPGTVFTVEVEQATPAASGGDSVLFLVSANIGETPRPIEKVASGGELSRIMLALKTVQARGDGVGTAVFDEIDTGISGKTSQKIGLKLKNLARASSTQVLCITHSPQIAALADNHMLISKRQLENRTITTVNELDDEGRVDELARIIGGITPGEAVRSAARELLEEGKKL